MDKKAKNTVKVHFDINNPPPMTAEQQQRLQVLSQMSDEEIDYSDSPSAENLNWQRIKQFSSTTHQSTITLQLDDDIIQYFQQFGKNWQTNLNSALRSCIERR
ncbi:MAG: BrnA antitoxin family protein [Neisseriaceae bacterium]|nr:BrnA antitoxin family protein [Neisseriaceae bacterium]